MGGSNQLFFLASALLFIVHTSATTSCCSALSTLGLDVSERSLSYFSLYQSAQHPACVVSPSTSTQMGEIFTLRSPCDLKFAVRSGGHMAWSGASNIDAPGFTIDLSYFRDIDYNENTQLVSFGAGLKWRDVYTMLAEKNRTVRGGRALDVGVGGFLLGGGISFPAESFSSSTVVEYEVVLASGEVVTSTETTLPDLFWALKLGSTNFGVVTRFTMMTQPYFDVWGGIQIYKSDALTSVTEAIVNLTLGYEGNVTEFLGVAFVGTVVWVPRIAKHALADLGSSSQMLSDTVTHKPVVAMYEEMSSAELARAAYHEWFTLTIKPDVQFALEIFAKGKEMFGGLDGWSVGLQPRPISEGEEPSLVVLFMASNPNVPMRDLVVWTESWTNLVKPSIYMNYASGDQDAYRGTDLTRLWAVKRKYDSNDFFDKHWAGGFKLPSVVQRDRSDL